MDEPAVVVGAGPNGLAAAITLARAGRRVVVLEANPTIGGGARSAELTLPGFVHDTCSAIHPLALGSPFFRGAPLREHGLAMVQPPAALAHPQDDGTAAVLERSVGATAATLGRDGAAYRRLMAPLVANWERLLAFLLGPFRLPPPSSLPPLLRFGPPALLPARLLAERLFRGQHARGLIAGIAAHAIQPLERPLTAGFALTLATLGHAVGWPLARGGSQRIADALASYLRSLGGEVLPNRRVRTLDDLPRTRTVLLDLTPRQVLAIAGERLPAGYGRKLAGYRYGPGIFKLDWALDAPIPWTAPACARAGTVHLGGTLAEIAEGERLIARGGHPERPFVLLAQQTLFDPTRAPAGQHTAWAYCHVPHGSSEDMADRVEAQVERFAPGFRARVLARHTMGPAELQRHNANFVGGDINGGLQDLRQFYTRPVASRVPYATPASGLYLCSSSTPPGGGVHGMCGYYAALAALRADG